MGERQVQQNLPGEQLRLFTKRLLTDLRALESMLANDMIGSGVLRVGAEQELFLVGDGWRPAGVAMEILEDIDDPHFTNELGKFNLEMNLDPLEFGGDCLSRMESQLNQLLEKARHAARRRGADVVLTGILPTLRKSDLGLDNMCPVPRYVALNRALNRLRGSTYDFRIKGLDELNGAARLGDARAVPGGDRRAGAYHVDGGPLDSQFTCRDEEPRNPWRASERHHRCYGRS